MFEIIAYSRNVSLQGQARQRAAGKLMWYYATCRPTLAEAKAHAKDFMRRNGAPCQIRGFYPKNMPSTIWG